MVSSNLAGALNRQLNNELLKAAQVYLAMATLAGKADNKVISKIVKQIIG